MERYYDGDQEALFKAAHVINPYVKPNRGAKVMTLFCLFCVLSANDLHSHLDKSEHRAYMKTFLLDVR